MQGLWSSIRPATEFSGVAIDFSEELWQDGFSADAFLQWWPRIGFPITGTLEFAYSRLGGAVYLDVQDPVFTPTPYSANYEFIYDYTQVNGLINFHPLLIPGDRDRDQSWASGIRISAGAQMAFPVSKNQVEAFSSTNPKLSTIDVAEIESEISSFFEGKQHWAGILGIGYQFFFHDYNFGLSLEGRVIYGFGDAILTIPNNRGYENTMIESIAVMGSLGLMYRIVKSD